MVLLWFLFYFFLCALKYVLYLIFQDTHFSSKYSLFQLILELFSRSIALFTYKYLFSRHLLYMDLLTNSYSFEPNGHLYPSVAFPLWICILIVPAIFLWMLVSFRQVAIFLLFDCYVSGHKWEHPHRQKKSTPSPPYRRTAQKQMGCHALQRPMREVTRNGDFLVFPSLGNNLPSNPLLYLPRSLFRAREIRSGSRWQGQSPGKIPSHPSRLGSGSRERQWGQFGGCWKQTLARWNSYIGSAIKIH